MIKQFRKKPVTISAVEFTGTHENRVELERFVGALLLKWKPKENEGGFIITLEGKMEFSQGDYIIKEGTGEFCPCKRDIFEVTYESVNN